ncbi:hypothetical protein S9a_00054 [Klebsiella phage S9a]|nr:hypothetical protein S9a_00054 [Klebsiella phage S9a]
MARNKFAGVCYYCKKHVPAGAGHYERYAGSWRTIHVECVFKQRAEKAQNGTYSRV